MSEDTATGTDSRMETYVVGYETGSVFLLRNPDGEFEPVDDLRELWLVQKFHEFEPAESLALEHNASVFEVWKKDNKMFLLRWGVSPPHHCCLG